MVQRERGSEKSIENAKRGEARVWISGDHITRSGKAEGYRCRWEPWEWRREVDVTGDSRIDPSEGGDGAAKRSAE